MLPADERVDGAWSIFGKKKGGPDGGIMNYSTAIFFSTSHSILEDSPGCSGFPWAPRLSDDST